MSQDDCCYREREGRERERREGEAKERERMQRGCWKNWTGLFDEQHVFIWNEALNSFQHENLAMMDASVAMVIYQSPTNNMFEAITRLKQSPPIRHPICLIRRFAMNYIQLLICRPYAKFSLHYDFTQIQNHKPKHSVFYFWLCQINFHSRGNSNFLPRTNACHWPKASV